MIPMSGSHHSAVDSETAMSLLTEGNRRYVEDGFSNRNTGNDRRTDTAENGQHPYAVIITCSDSRVVPEFIFDAGIGDLFVIRTAGNTCDVNTLGSAEYAVDHLGCKLVVVLGHTQCGAVQAASEEVDDELICAITSKIREASEKGSGDACSCNVCCTLGMLKERLHYQDDVRFAGAVYDIRSGRVTFLD